MSNRSLGNYEWNTSTVTGMQSKHCHCTVQHVCIYTTIIVVALYLGHISLCAQSQNKWRQMHTCVKHHNLNKHKDDRNNLEAGFAALDTSYMIVTWENIYQPQIIISFSTSTCWAYQQTTPQCVDSFLKVRLMNCDWSKRTVCKMTFYKIVKYSL